MNGHGTHVSATIGGTKYGVAKKATIIGVKVLGDDGSGSNSGVIAGLQWAAENAEDAGAINTSVSPLLLSTPMEAMLILQVANMSLGSRIKSVAVNNAVAAVVRMGMTVCVAAGNDNVWSTYPPFPLSFLPSPPPTYLRLTSLKHSGTRRNYFPSFRANCYHRWSYR